MDDPTVRLLGPDPGEIMGKKERGTLKKESSLGVQLARVARHGAAKDRTVEQQVDGWLRGIANPLTWCGSVGHRRCMYPY